MRLLPCSALLMTSLILTACGGGGSGGDNTSAGTGGPDTGVPAGGSPSTPATLITLSGAVAADTTATVCLDRNLNLRCDTTEPTALTDASHHYTLANINSVDAGNYPVIAEVAAPAPVLPAMVVAAGIHISVGGLNPAYTLTTPIGKHAFISPITTLLVEELRERGGALAGAEEMLKYRMRMPDADLYGDYTAAGSANQIALKTLAASAANAFTANLATIRADLAAASYPSRTLHALAVRHFLKQLSWGMQLVLTHPGADTQLYFAPLSSANINAGFQLSVGEELALLSKNTSVPTGDFFTSTAYFTLDAAFESNCAYSGLNEPCPAYPSNHLLYSRTSYQPGVNDIGVTRQRFLLNPQTGQIRDSTLFNHTLVLRDNGWVDYAQLSSAFPRATTSQTVIRKVDLTGVHINPFLRRYFYLLNNFTATQHIPAVSATASFAPQSFAYLVLNPAESEEYVIRDRDYTTDAFDYRVRQMPDGSRPLTSLAELRAQYSADLPDTAKWDIRGFGNISEAGTFVDLEQRLQFRADHTLRLSEDRYAQTGELIGEDVVPGGTWDEVVIHGQTLMRLHLPPRFNDALGTETFLTVINNQVVEGTHYLPHYTTEHIYYDRAAFASLASAFGATLP